MARRRPPLVERMRPHAASIFGDTSRRAREVGAINLGQGFPDTDGPAELAQIAIEAIRAGYGNQYPPAHGLPDLRTAISEHQRRFYGLDVDPETDVVVGTGASEVLVSTLLALCEPGDEVLTFEPWFDLYAAGIALTGARQVDVPMRPPDFRPDLDALRDAVTPRTRVILLNTPHNPTGVVWTRDELQVLADIAIERDVLVLSDEAYEHLWFDGHPHVPIATLPGMAERTITVGSGGKSFSFTGWKVGWATGTADLIGAVRVVRQHLSFVSGGPFQYAIATGLRLPDAYFEGFRADLQAKRDLLTSGLESVGFTVTPSQGTYFLTTDLGPFDAVDGRALCQHLVESCGVAAIPLQALCASGVGDQAVRWAFCKRPEVLRDAVDRLAASVGMDPPDVAG